MTSAASPWASSTGLASSTTPPGRRAASSHPRSTDGLDRQGQLPAALALSSLEPRDADAEQAHGPRRVEPAQQLARHPPHLLGAVHRDRPAAAPLTGEAVAQANHELVEHALELGQRDDVAVEGRLPRLGDDL